jgi:hypothetical protein
MLTRVSTVLTLPTALVALIVLSTSGCAVMTPPPDEAFTGVEQSLATGSLLIKLFGENASMTRSDKSEQSASIGTRVVFNVTGSRGNGTIDVQADRDAADQPWHAHIATVTFEGGEPVRYEFNDYDGVWTVMPTN